jgi:hypothetical protein
VAKKLWKSPRHFFGNTALSSICRGCVSGWKTLDSHLGGEGVWEDEADRGSDFYFFHLLVGLRALDYCFAFSIAPNIYMVIHFLFRKMPSVSGAISVDYFLV